MSAVLAVVLMVLKIIGMILLALLLLLLLALLLPAGIHFRWSHIGGLRLQLCYGPLHFTLYPRKADEEKKGRTEGRNKAGEHAQNRADFRRTAQANPAACKSGTARTTYNGKADGTHGSKARKSAGRTPKSGTGPAR